MASEIAQFPQTFRSIRNLYVGCQRAADEGAFVEAGATDDFPLGEIYLCAERIKPGQDAAMSNLQKPAALPQDPCRDK